MKSKTTTTITLSGKELKALILDKLTEMPPFKAESIKLAISDEDGMLWRMASFGDNDTLSVTFVPRELK
jgi:hypothetical protein